MNMHENVYRTPVDAHEFYVSRTLAAVAATVVTALWMAAAQPTYTGAATSVATQLASSGLKMPPAQDAGNG